MIYIYIYIIKCVINYMLSTDEICKEVNCGRGTCKVAIGSKFNFKCECEANWRRTRFDEEDEDDLEFLPCVIPNCKYFISK